MLRSELLTPIQPHGIYRSNSSNQPPSRINTSIDPNRLIYEDADRGYFIYRFDRNNGEEELLHNLTTISRS
jgi:hypothetical protein